MIGENECVQITPELLFSKPNRNLAVILSVRWANKKEEKQRSREKEGNDWGKLMRPNNPRIAILEPEQKFGGYSFCQLGKQKGREAKKKRKGRQ